MLSPFYSYMLKLTPADFSYAMWVQTSVYKVKSLKDNTLEFGSGRVGVGEVRYREGKVCMALKSGPPKYKISIKNLHQRS